MQPEYELRFSPEALSRINELLGDEETAKDLLAAFEKLEALGLDAATDWKCPECLRWMPIEDREKHNHLPSLLE